MTVEEFKKLSTGDIVASKTKNETYVVTSNYGDRVTAVKTVDLTNPQEWELRSKVTSRETQ